MTVFSENDDFMYWKKNKEWYGHTEDGRVFIKDSAPPEAKESFEKFLKTNTD